MLLRQFNKRMNHEIRYHPRISQSLLKDLVVVYNSIDTILSIHYSNNIKNPSLQKVLDSVSSLLNKRITNHEICQILEIDSSNYNLLNNHDDILISPTSISNFSRLIPERKARFIESLNNWILQNKDKSTLPTKELSSYYKFEKQTRVIKDHKIVKPVIKKTSNDLKNIQTKFEFKSKDNDKLSLIERIKLKEKTARLAEPPSNTREDYINSRLVSIYNIIYEFHGIKSHKSYPFSKMVSLVKNSLKSPMSNDEIIDTLNKIANQLDNFEIVDRSEVKVLKISKLDRNLDISKLQ